MKPIRLTRGPLSGSTFAVRQYRERADGVIVTGTGDYARTDVSAEYDALLLADVLGDPDTEDDVTIMQALDAAATGERTSPHEQAALSLLWDRLNVIALRHNQRVESAATTGALRNTEEQ